MSILGEEELEDYISKHPDASLADIASHFVVSYPTVSNAIKLYDIPYENKLRTGTSILNENELKSFIDAHPDLNLEAIASHFQVTRLTVSRAINLYEIFYQPKTRSGSSIIDREDLAAFVSNNPWASVEVIARSFKVDPSTARRAIGLYDIPYEWKEPTPVIPFSLGQRFNEPLSLSSEEESRLTDQIRDGDQKALN